ncbi:hypothetical protein ACFYSJ_30235 [Streptomyces sp. NPDC005248]|uniref:hypothetical protein n=1 Tax=Streptomyces sp. NPDC005248 TaxID=3364709 RepID=UPI0036906E43
MRLHGYVHGYRVAFLAGAALFTLALAATGLLAKATAPAPPPPDHPHRKVPHMNSANESAAFWEKHYAGMDAQWGTKPNAVLTTLLAAWRPELSVEHPPAHCLKVVAVPAGADS